MTDLIALARECGAHPLIIHNRQVGLTFNHDQLAAFAARIASQGNARCEGIEAAFAAGRDAMEGAACPHHPATPEAHWWTRGFAYTARALRAVDAEREIATLKAQQRIIQEPPGCPTPGACSCPAAYDDSAPPIWETLGAIGRENAFIDDDCIASEVASRQSLVHTPAAGAPDALADDSKVLFVAARALSDRTAALCNVDKEDQWKLYCDDFIGDAEAVLTAARKVLADKGPT